MLRIVRPPRAVCSRQRERKHERRKQQRTPTSHHQSHRCWSISRCQQPTPPPNRCRRAFRLNPTTTMPVVQFFEHRTVEKYQRKMETCVRFFAAALSKRLASASVVSLCVFLQLGARESFHAASVFGHVMRQATVRPSIAAVHTHTHQIHIHVHAIRTDPNNNCSTTTATTTTTR